MRSGVVVCCGLVLGFCQAGVAQDVVSATAGVLQYFEGSVAINNSPVEHKAGVFPSLKNGATISTAKGRAELLLTPGAYLRMDENTSLRMESNSLTDTRLELTQGTIILDTLNANGKTPVAIHMQDSTARFPKAGVYRIDAELSELEAFSGEAEVTHQEMNHQTATSKVDGSHLYYFGIGLTTTKFGDGAMDEFYDWARNRSEIIAQQNEVASAEQDAAQDPDPGLGGGAVLGVPPVTPLPDPSYSNGPFTTVFGSTLGASAIGPFGYPGVWPGITPAFGIIVLPPLRHWPVGTKGPIGITTAYRPLPTPVHWPKPTNTVQSHSYYLPGIPHPITSLPTYRPITAPRPVITTVPHVSAPHFSAPPVAARPVMPHIGHR